MKIWTGATIPNGYLLCDGRAISRQNYKALFSVIGTTYGSGDGSSTFNIPDMRDRFPQGANNNLGENIVAGLPNITGELSIRSAVGAQGNDSTGAFRNDGTSKTHMAEATPYSGIRNPTFNAALGETKTDGTLKSKDEPHVYGKSGTVQPPAVAINYIVRY